MAATIIVDEVHFDGGAVIGKLEGFGNCWFDWPLDFDPYWLLECSYFKPKNGIVFA